MIPSPKCRPAVSQMPPRRLPNAGPSSPRCRPVVSQMPPRRLPNAAPSSDVWESRSLATIDGARKQSKQKKGLKSCVRTQPYRKTLMFPFHFLNGFCQLLQSLPDDGTWLSDVEPHVACTSRAEHLAVVEGKMGFVDKQIE